ncbi:FecR family protein [Paenibacillus sp. UMB4589-SE434]|uniref:FecR family protein n=1 Tax=Paenibacillus sp. UMB4589-SE434 TaxID=3046314 RepID=UPI00254B0F6A|nr:FecR family protein [Paenibacillus sp. UMB4589-SE434]MDK8182513.1 FecR family protein [Paenibacillus sp. UMB4589-SE434]
MKRVTCIVLSFVMLFAAICGGVSIQTTAAAAKLVRAAVVTEWKGKVLVEKVGGKKPLQVFKKMSINQGDRITTGAKSKVVLQLAGGAEQDVVTIGENSDVSFTELKKDKGVVTRISVWAGSAWLKVKSIAGADDRFELETPTTVMAVRGTQFGVYVHPMAGWSRLTVSAGVVRVYYPYGVADDTLMAGEVSGADRNAAYAIAPASWMKAGGPLLTLGKQDIYPAQSSTFIPVGGSRTGMLALQSYADPKGVAPGDTAIIRAMVEGYTEAQAENKTMLDQWSRSCLNGAVESICSSLYSYSRLGMPNDSKESSLSAEAVKALKERAIHNVQSYLDAVLSMSVRTGVITEGEAANWRQRGGDSQQAGSSSNQEQLRLSIDELKQTAYVAERLQETLPVTVLSEELRDLKDKLMEEGRQREEVQKKLDKEVSKQLVASYLEQLTAKERDQFNERKNQAHTELCENAANVLSCETDEDNPGGSGGAGAGGNGGGIVTPPPETLNVLELKGDSASLQAGKAVLVHAVLKRFQVSPLVGSLELAIEVEGGQLDTKLLDSQSTIYRHGVNGKFKIAHNADQYVISNAIDQWSSTGNLFYYQLLRTKTGAAQLSNDDVLISLPYVAQAGKELKLTIKQLKMYDAEGKTITATAAQKPLIIPIVP